MSCALRRPGGKFMHRDHHRHLPARICGAVLCLFSATGLANRRAGSASTSIITEE